MALARVVTFDGVSKDRMEEMDREMSEGQPPEGFPSSELIVLHDPEAEQSLLPRGCFFSLDDIRQRHAAVNCQEQKSLASSFSAHCKTFVFAAIAHFPACWHTSCN